MCKLFAEFVKVGQREARDAVVVCGDFNAELYSEAKTLPVLLHSFFCCSNFVSLDKRQCNRFLRGVIVWNPPFHSLVRAAIRSSLHVSKLIFCLFFFFSFPFPTGSQAHRSSVFQSQACFARHCRAFHERVQAPARHFSLRPLRHRGIL